MLLGGSKGGTMGTRDVYIGTFTAEWKSSTPVGSPAEGIEHFRFDETTGALEHLDTTRGLESPQFLAAHPTLPVLYAAEDTSPGYISTLTIGPGGVLEPRARTTSVGNWPAHMSVHPSGGHAYAGNYRSGIIVAFPIDTEGIAGTVDAAREIEGKGRGSLPRNEASHPHQIRPFPNGEHVLVCDVGYDILLSYPTEADGSFAPTSPVRVEFPPESAPRNIEFDANGRYLYVVGETDSMLYVLEADGGVPGRIIGTYPTAPTGFEGHNSPSEIVLHPDRQTLYVANRGSNTVTIFHLDPVDGSVELLGHESAIDRVPRGIEIVPGGRFLIVTNMDPGTVVVYRIGADRLLEPVGSPVPCNSPSMSLFV